MTAKSKTPKPPEPTLRDLLGQTVMFLPNETTRPALHARIGVVRTDHKDRVIVAADRGNFGMVDQIYDVDFADVCAIPPDQLTRAEELRDAFWKARRDIADFADKL